MRRNRILVMTAVLAGLARPSMAETVAALLDSPSSTLGGNAPTALALLRIELERRGLSVAPVEAVGDTLMEPEAARAALEAKGVNRVFVLSVMPLGEKLVVGLGERRLPGLDVQRSERMTAARIEELDTVLPRLVEAVLTGRSPEQTVSITTVTEQESRGFRKRSGQFLWGLGIPFGASLRPGSEVSYGLALRFSYEMEHARIDADSWFQGNVKEHMIHWNAVAIGAYWLPLASDISPYLGGGIGYGGSAFRDQEHAMGVIVNVGAGVEFFRLYGTRLMFDVRAGLPTYRVEGEDGGRSWVPVFTAMLSFLW